MAQKRIYQIAKELNISHVEIIKFLQSKDIEIANQMAPVDNNVYDSILMEGGGNSSWCPYQTGDHR